MTADQDQEFELLLNALLPFAQSLLSKYGEFHPFGAHLGTNGEKVMDAIEVGPEHADSHSVVDGLVGVYRDLASKQQLRACAICYDATVEPPGSSRSDAIGVSLEHIEGKSIIVYMPYEKKLFGGYKYRDLLGEAAPGRVFESSAS